MRLRYKTALIVIVAVFAFIVVSHSIYTVAITASFAEMEKEDMYSRITGAVNIFERRIDRLASSAKDWGVWDDTYAFAEDRNEDYIATNLVDNSFANLEINFLLIFDSSSRLVYGKAYDLDAGSEVLLPDELLSASGGDPILCSDGVTSLKGVAYINGSYAIFASQPVLTSLGTGPFRGTLIMGRYVDSKMIESISDQAQLPVYAARADAATLFNFSGTQPNGEGLSVIPVDADTIAAKAVMPDAYGIASMALVIENNRDIYNNGLQLQAFFTYSSLGAAVIFGALVMLSADRLFLTKVASLNGFVDRIKKEGKKNIKVQLPGHDELSKLADSVDEMADSLELSKDDLKKYTEKLEALVEERTKKLQDAQRLSAIGETATMVGHDLRNPLQAIIYELASLKEEASSCSREDILAFSGFLERQVFYMNKIVSDLQDYARHLTPKKATVSLSKFSEDLLSAVVIPKNIKVKKEIPDGTAACFDPHLMKRALTNIIVNAVQAMAEGGTLAFSARDGEGGLEIMVSDTGEGMPEEGLGNIFRPFFTTKPKGQGLGLPVAKRIVEAHGGTIRIESKTDVGTTISIFIPNTGNGEEKKERQVYVS